MTMTPEEALAMALQLAEEVVSAANIVSHDGYYELNIDAVIVVLSEAIDRMQERVRAETGWQDIATAPKDGSDILILAHGMCVQARYCPGEWFHGHECSEYSGACWCAFDDALEFEIEETGPEMTDAHHGPVTHWRPLLAPPAIRETPHAEG